MNDKIRKFLSGFRSDAIPKLRRVWDGCGYYISLAVLLAVFASVAYIYRNGNSSEDTVSTAAYSAESLPAMAHTMPSASPEPTPEPGLIMPTNGDIIGEFSPDRLIWNDSLKQWQTHPGIDISSPEGAAIAACADGIVSAAYEDPLWGNTLEITHVDGTISRYSPLISIKITEEGERVQAGDIIGSLDAPPPAESAAEPHLHFELLGENGPIMPVFRQ